MKPFEMNIHEFTNVARNAGWRVESGAPVWERVMLFRGSRRWCFKTLLEALVWYKAYAAITARYYDRFAPSLDEGVLYEISAEMLAAAEKRDAAQQNAYADDDGDDDDDA